MKRRTIIKGLAAAVPASLMGLSPNALLGLNAGEEEQESMMKGPFAPSWDSLQQYKVPAWFRNAKFGIWAHWGAQCQPEFGDWYARNMYIEGSKAYNYHLQKYGHPSRFGFKDVIHEWKAEAWDPEELLALYSRAGAKYFVALANHHDNFDNYNSKYQPWNSLNIGPHKDLIGGWANAARKHGLKFGVSVHASHAWTWYEQAQKADKNGPLAGVPYDGNISRADGNNKWWKGFDPQALYAQRHAPSEGFENADNMGKQWDWGNGASKPDNAYCNKFFNRTVDLINQYNPDLLYFDDTALPLWPVSDAGLRIAAHFYNRNLKINGSLQAVLNAKILNEEQRKCMVWDIERGQSNAIEPFAWQTDTCIGHWHYDRPLYEKHGYKTAKTVIHTLIDVVSKNGNLLLSVPVSGDGTIDEEERSVVEGIGEWMKVNSDAIYDTRPWKIFGEGPGLEQVAALSAQGFNEGKGKPLGASDFRFTQKGDTLYVFAMGWPEDRQLHIKALAANSPLLTGKKIETATLLGYGDRLTWIQQENAMLVMLPVNPPCESAVVIKCKLI